MTSDENQVVELENEFIVIAVPAATLSLEITATVWLDGKTVDVARSMPFDEVRAAIKEAQDGYIPSDTVFTLTDLGKKEVEQLKEKYRDTEDW